MDAGHRLRRRREHLRLTYRDVEEASAQIAARRRSDAYQIGLSRLADIEHRGTVPSMYRLYSLAAIYGLSFSTLLEWYGVDLSNLPGDSAGVPRLSTQIIDQEPPPSSSVPIPILREPLPELRATFFISRHLEEWGRVPAALLPQPEAARRRYAFVGLDDWFMYPLIRPGSFIHVDETHKKVSPSGWENEWERPIYFVEHHAGYRCAWCSVRGSDLILQPHPASQEVPETYKLGSEAEVIGEVSGVAMRLNRGGRHHRRFAKDRE